MPSRFIVSRAARAVGITCRDAGRLDLDQRIGRDRLDLGHDDVRPLLLDQARSAAASIIAITCARCATCWPGALA